MRLAVDLKSPQAFAWMIVGGALEFAAEHHDVEVILRRASLHQAPKVPLSEWDALVTGEFRKDFTGPQVSTFSVAGDECPNVRTNERGVAELVINQFMELGLKHFAFIGEGPGISDVRYRAFCSVVSEYGLTPLQATVSDTEKILALPRPCGVMVVNDPAGIKLLRNCQRLDIRVPEEFSVIAVDNSPLCLETSPPMSSVIMPFSSIGHRAAARCYDLFHGKSIMQREELPPPGIVLRESAQLPGTGKIAGQVARYIRNHRSEPIVMDDIVRQHNLSRRRLEQLFRDVYETSPMAYLQDMRLEKAKGLLRESEDTVQEIALRCGYLDANTLCRAFRKHLGTSPGRYRKG